MIQLNPAIPFLHEGRHCTAVMALDYSQEHETLFLCGFDDTRELWWIPHSKLRLTDNISLGRLQKK